MLNLIRVIEVSMFVLALAFFATQVFIPAWRGTALFPLFRRESKLQKELAYRAAGMMLQLHDVNSR